MTVSSAANKLSQIGWRTPLVVLVCGGLIGCIGFGPRASLGLYLTPMSSVYGWGRDVFGLALAIQVLVWGASQPFFGALADRFGSMRVLVAGGLLYCAGLVQMAYATTPGMLDLAATTTGLGIGASSFTIVIATFSKLLPPHMRTLAFGVGTAAGSFGQFLFSPLAIAFIGLFGWQHALVAFGFITLLIIPLSFAVRTPPMDMTSRPGAAQKQSLRQALAEAFGHRSYVLLVLGFFTCGFQLQFITVHLPAYLVDRGLSVDVGAWAIGTIGLFNIVGSITAGWLGDRMSKRYLLSIIYVLRSAIVVIFITLPITATSAIMFAGGMGLLWLSTVPPTSALVALMFGTRWMATLFGFAFFSHQVGGFLGVWLGGVLYERTGSYDVVWWLSAALGIVSALINVPIVEKPVERPGLAAA
jgi:MFS family permease